MTMLDDGQGSKPIMFNFEDPVRVIEGLRVQQLKNSDRRRYFA
jgi:hypothetical protein